MEAFLGVFLCCSSVTFLCRSSSPEPSALVSVLVVISVMAIVGVSVGIWFLHQRHSGGSSLFAAFEYHPPFRVLENDQSCLVEAEETDDAP